MNNKTHLTVKTYNNADYRACSLDFLIKLNTVKLLSLLSKILDISKKN